MHLSKKLTLNSFLKVVKDDYAIGLKCKNCKVFS